MTAPVVEVFDTRSGPATYSTRAPSGADATEEQLAEVAGSCLAALQRELTARGYVASQLAAYALRDRKTGPYMVFAEAIALPLPEGS